MHPLTTRILHQQQSPSKHRNITQNYVQHQNSLRHVYQYIKIPSEREQLVEGSVPYKGIPILPQHFPLYSSREVVPLLPYLLHLWAMTYIICEWSRESPLRGECTSSWTIHVLLHECFTFGQSLIKNKKNNYLKYCICTCTLEVNRLFLNINVTLMSGHSTHGPWCHCLLLVSGTGGEGYLIHIVTILHILHLKNTM